MTDPDELLARIQQNTRRALWYARSRFLGTWLAVALLAILTGVALIIASRSAETNLQQTEDIARVADTTAEQASMDANAATEDTDQITAFLRGEQGIPGVPGADGQDGSPGQPGSSGSLGPPGPQGEPGRAGDAGEQGPQGPGGAGSPGQTGAKGDAGAAGSEGAAGERGAKGDKGDKGDEGPPGTPGTQGHQGEQGPIGPQGPAGPEGPRGPAGPPTTFVTVFATGPMNAASPKSQNAFCPSGQRVVGGGFSLDPPTGVRVTVSLPLGNEVWNVQAEQDGVPGAWALTAWAICAAT